MILFSVVGTIHFSFYFITLKKVLVTLAEDIGYLQSDVIFTPSLFTFN